MFWRDREKYVRWKRIDLTKTLAVDQVASQYIGGMSHRKAYLRNRGIYPSMIRERLYIEGQIPKRWSSGGSTRISEKCQINPLESLDE